MRLALTYGVEDPVLPASAYDRYTVDQAAAQITRDDLSWSRSLGSAATVSFAFRSTDAGYDNGVDGFAPFNKAQIDTALLSFQSWSDVANITFSRSGSGDSGAGAYSNNATILLGDYTSGADHAAAFTYLPETGAEGGDVWVNSSLSYNAAPGLLNYGMMTLTHEIGHAIGLEHPGDYDASDDTAPTYWNDAAYREDTRQYSIMSYFDESETGADFGGAYAPAPLLDDIAAAQRLYGANMTTRSGDTVYGFHSTADRPWFSATSSTSQLVCCIWDGGGHDTLDLSGYTTASNIELTATSFSSVGGLAYNLSIAQGVVIEDAIGGSGGDTIGGNEAANHLWGGAGDDALFGLDGSDTLSGGTGDNTLNGGDGADTVSYAALGSAIVFDSGIVSYGQNRDYITQVETVVGTAHADTFHLLDPNLTVLGGAGDDQVRSYRTGVVFDGGSGVDTITFSAAGTAVTVDIGAVTSVERLSGGAYADQLTGNADSNLISGSAGNDTLEGGGGADTLDGGGDVNTVSFAHAGTAVRVNLPAGTATVGASQETLRHISGVIGSSFADVVVATGSHAALFGGDGDDTFQLSAAPLSAAESVDGGAGSDTLSFSSAKASVRLSLAGANGEVVGSIEHVIGSAFGDRLSGSLGAEVLDGRGGDDTLAGGGGADSLIGSGGVDTATYAAAIKGVSVDLGAGLDSFGAHLGTVENVVGSAYRDLLTGDGSDNLLNGGAGGDTLTGGAGADTLLGGAAKDVFAYLSANQSSARTGVDLIADLESSDVVDLSAVDANKKAAGDQAFTIVVQFDKHAAELVLTYDAALGETQASMDTNGDGKADMVIRLAGDQTAFDHFVL